MKLQVHWCGPAVHAVQEEKNAAQLLDEEERPQFVPTAYDSLRRVSQALALGRPPLGRTAVTGCLSHTQACHAVELQQPAALLCASLGAHLEHVCPPHPLMRRCPPTPASSRSGLSAAWTCTSAPAPAASASSSRVRQRGPGLVGMS